VTNGWTGGQYSLFRVALAAGAAVSAIGAPAPLGLGAMALALCLPLLLGYRDRWAALALAGLQVAGLWGPSPWGPSPGVGALLLMGLLVAHAFAPVAPWGSWDARARADAGHGWALPPAVYAAGWIALALCYAGSGYAALAPASVEAFAQRGVLEWAGIALALLFAPLALARRLRPRLWTAGLAVQLVPAAFGLADLGFAIWLLHFFAFDPAWVRARALPGPAAVFYDGHCGLCHRVVRFLLSEDADGSAFRFAPLDSDAFRSQLSAHERDALPDSVVVLAPGRVPRVRSAAALDLAERLGGLWRVAALALRPVPQAWLDRVYDGVAASRQRVFGREDEACPRVSTDLRSRFLD